MITKADKQKIDKFRSEIGLPPADDEPVLSWNCRFHPTDWWHTTGCPHRGWSIAEYRNALEGTYPISLQRKKYLEDRIEELKKQGFH